VLATSTLGRHLTSIRQAHKTAGHPSPTSSEAVLARTSSTSSEVEA
jgi:hypothetical protein